jgi:hypothetical protein
MKTIFECGGPNRFKGAKTKSLIQVDQQTSGRKLFTLTYGLERKEGLTYAQACAAIGQAILHWQCCEGIADNTGA